MGAAALHQPLMLYNVLRMMTKDFQDRRDRQNRKIRKARDMTTHLAQKKSCVQLILVEKCGG